MGFGCLEFTGYSCGLFIVQKYSIQFNENYKQIDILACIYVRKSVCTASFVQLILIT